MENINIESFNIIGIWIKTTNENEQSAKDIPELWNKFLADNTIEKIPNKLSNDMYCVYTDYESDYTGPYMTLIGCKVSSLENIPEGLKGITINKGSHKKFVVKGNLMQGVIWQEWLKIWKSGLDRTYATDFEIYGEKAQNPENAEVEIFVGVK